MKLLLFRIRYTMLVHIPLLFVYTTIFCSYMPLFAQETTIDNASSEFVSGNWLISTVESTNSKKGLTKLGNVITALMNNNIIPQAFDRNYEGKFLIISQKSPPASHAKQWNLEAYPSEEEMLKNIETQSKKGGWVPTAFDVQQDAAFVLSLKSRDVINSFRLIKVNNANELINSVQAQQELGFIPIAMSSFVKSIWIMYARYPSIPAESMDIIIKSPTITEMGLVIDKVLAEKGSQILAATTTAEEKMILIFLSPAKTPAKKRP